MAEELKIINIRKQNLSAFSPLVTPNYYRQIQSGVLEAFGAVCEGVAVGILVFGVKQGGIFLLHDISVAPTYRQQGIAAKLLTWFTELSLDEGALILTSFDDTPDSSARKMLEACGFTITESSAKRFIVPFGALGEIAVLDHVKYTEQVKPISLEERPLWKRFCRKQQERGNALLVASYDAESVQELNLCIRSGMGLAGCVTADRLSEEAYELSHACVGENQSWALLPLLSVLRGNLLRMGNPSARLHMTAVTDASVRLAEKLLPEGCESIGRKQAVFKG